MGQIQVHVGLREDIHINRDEWLYSNNQHAHISASLPNISPRPVGRSSCQVESCESEGRSGDTGIPFCFYPYLTEETVMGPRFLTAIHHELCFPFAYWYVDYYKAKGSREHTLPQLEAHSLP